MTQIKLSLDTCTVISAIISHSLEEGRDKLFSAKMATELASHEMFKEMLPEDLRDKLPDVKKRLKEWESHIKDFEAAIQELSEVVPDFAKIHECGKHVKVLIKKFKDAKNWSLEEKEAYLNICKYTEENREFISAKHDEITKESGEYLKIWEEKNAGNTADS